jgi:hypothetical protein
MVPDRPRPPRTQPFSDELEAWLRADSPNTLSALGNVFNDRSFAVMILVLMFVPALPVPTGGVTHVFELITVVLGAQMVAGRRTVWLPARWKNRELGSVTTGKALPFIVRRIRWFERLSRPRLRSWFEHPWMLRLLGGEFIALAIAAALAPPFSGLDTLPALGAVIVALAIVLQDVVLLMVGTAIGAAGVALIVTVGAAVLHFVSSLV